MTELETRLLTLLNELDSICNENNIDYFLSHEVALHAYRSKKFEKPLTYLTVLMPLESALKFSEAVKKINRDDREIDSLFENINYPNLTFRYSDKNSLCINLNENIDIGFKSHGIFIKILIIRSRQKNFTRLLMRGFEYGWVYRDKGHTSKIFYKRMIQRGCRLLIKINKPFYVKTLLNLFVKTQKDFNYNEELIYRSMYGKVNKFPKDIFSTKQMIKFENKKYPIPLYAGPYFRSLYGLKWETYNFSNKKISDNYIIDLKLPYRSFFEYYEHKENFTLLKEMIHLEKKATQAVKSSNKAITKAWNQVCRTGARFNMWWQYMPLKDQIIKLYTKQNWKKLETIFKDYDDVIREFDNKKMSVFFDREIFNIYKELLIRNGDNKLASRIESRIPECHQSPIEIERREVR